MMLIRFKELMFTFINIVFTLCLICLISLAKQASREAINCISFMHVVMVCTCIMYELQLFICIQIMFVMLKAKNIVLLTKVLS